MFDDEQIVKEKLYGMEEHERWEFVKRFLNDDEIIDGILEIIGEDAVAEVAHEEREDWKAYAEDRALERDFFYCYR